MTATTTPEETGRSGEATRARLLDAGIAVLSERGYHAARVDDVAAAAGVSHGTFYLYFANKDELMVALAAACAADLVGLITNLSDIDDDAAGQRAFRRWLEEFVSHYRAYGVVIRSWVENQSRHPELTRLGVENLGLVSGALVERIRAAHPEDAELRVSAFIAVMERFTYHATTKDLGEETLVLDTAATVLHRAFFASA